MTIGELKEILMHYQDRKYDDWEMVLWDFNNQRKLEWADGTYASSKLDKRITFPVRVEPVDGVTINERLKNFIKEYKENKK